MQLLFYKHNNFVWADDRDWTGDLFLTKEVLYQLSYISKFNADAKLGEEIHHRLSGRRDSNPRPTAWKAVTLPTELLPQQKTFFANNKKWTSGRRGIRTPKGVSQRIYSPPRLSNSGVRPDTFHPLSQKASNKYRGSNLKKQESRYNFLLLLLILVYFKPFLIILW